MACVSIWQLLCVVCIYIWERYRTNKYPNLQRTAPNQNGGLLQISECWLSAEQKGKNPSNIPWFPFQKPLNWTPSWRFEMKWICQINNLTAMNMNINIVYITWLRSWLRNWKSCPLASLAPAMADLRPWNHLGSDLTMDLCGLCSHLAIIICCLHIYIYERDIGLTNTQIYGGLLQIKMADCSKSTLTNAPLFNQSLW